MEVADPFGLNGLAVIADDIYAGMKAFLRELDGTSERAAVVSLGITASLLALAIVPGTLVSCLPDTLRLTFKELLPKVPAVWGLSFVALMCLVGFGSAVVSLCAGAKPPWRAAVFFNMLLHGFFLLGFFGMILGWGTCRLPVE